MFNRITGLKTKGAQERIFFNNKTKKRQDKAFVQHGVDC